jgi:hypothetical protein
MVRGLILQRGHVNRGSLCLFNRSLIELFGISPPFDGLFPTEGQIIHALLTRAPLYSPTEVDFLVRLACVRHAASVCSEPGSNSPVLILSEIALRLFYTKKRTHKSIIPLFNFERANLERALLYRRYDQSCQELFQKIFEPLRTADMTTMNR